MKSLLSGPAFIDTAFIDTRSTVLDTPPAFPDTPSAVKETHYRNLVGKHVLSGHQPSRSEILQEKSFDSKLSGNEVYYTA